MTPAQIMTRRKDAAQACLTRFADKPYEVGKRDCTKMALHLLHKLSIRAAFAKGVRYSSEIGGVKFLKRSGFDTLIQAVDGLGLLRIAPAAALVGDLVALPTTSPLGSLAVCVGPGQLLAYGEDFAGATVIGQVKQYVDDADGPCAWRTLPLPGDII